MADDYDKCLEIIDQEPKGIKKQKNKFLTTKDGFTAISVRKDGSERFLKRLPTKPKLGGSSYKDPDAAERQAEDLGNI